MGECNAQKTSPSISFWKNGLLAVGLATLCASASLFGAACPAYAEEGTSEPALAASSTWDTSRYGTSLGSLGFFNWEADNYGTSTDSMAGIVAELTGKKSSSYTPTSLELDDEGKTYLSYTHLGEENDSTSLENMKTALEWLKQGNDLRSKVNAQNGLTSEGQTTIDANGLEQGYLRPLKVSDYCMLTSQINTNWSASHIRHSAIYWVGEILAWNQGDISPYTQWYDEELAYILSVKAEHPGDANWQDYVNPGEAGHYYNIVDTRYKATGFAVNTTGALYPYTYGQTFDLFDMYMPAFGDAVPFDEYYNRFMTYYNLVQAHANENTMWRLYNKSSGEHFYTASAGERDLLVEAGWRYEGVAWTAPTSSTQPVYRLYNVNGGDHHYTTSAGERDLLVSKGWRDEGVGWYSDTNNGVPVYRQYNRNAKSGAHNFTTSAGERDLLVSKGWRDEGIGWYGVA